MPRIAFSCMDLRILSLLAMDTPAAGKTVNALWSGSGMSSSWQTTFAPAPSTRRKLRATVSRSSPKWLASGMATKKANPDSSMYFNMPSYCG